MVPIFKCSLLVLATVVTLATPAAVNTETEMSTFSKQKQTETVITKTIVNEVTYLPPMLVIGTKNGSIIRCPHESPSACEVYHKGNSAVNAVLVHGEYLFAGLKSGAMLGCTWQQRHSCEVFYQANSEIIGLAVATGYIYAGLNNGTILRCQLNTHHKCRTFADLGTSIDSIAVFGSFIYAGSDNGRIDSCSLATEQSCTKFCEDGGGRITGMARSGDKIYAVRIGGALQYCEMTSHKSHDYGIPSSGYHNMVLYNGQLFTARENEGIYIHNPVSRETPVFAAHINVISFSITYGTYGMQTKYVMESRKCIWDGVFTCPPTVTYSRIQDRTPLEVSVEGGKLYDSQGVLIDTSDADEARSQKAAIFVMGPDGQILLSKFHRKGYFHTSSLLAGNPVSGAGLMVVERGKIMNITACSVHYRPDVDLNKQVIDSLRQKGYTDSIDSYPCTYNYNGNCAIDDPNANDIY